MSHFICYQNLFPLHIQRPWFRNISFYVPGDNFPMPISFYTGKAGSVKKSYAYQNEHFHLLNPTYICKVWKFNIHDETLRHTASKGKKKLFFYGTQCTLLKNMTFFFLNGNKDLDLISIGYILSIPFISKMLTQNLYRIGNEIYERNKVT
jgi:hypothetical protein